MVYKNLFSILYDAIGERKLIYKFLDNKKILLSWFMFFLFIMLCCNKIIGDKEQSNSDEIAKCEEI